MKYLNLDGVSKLWEKSVAKFALKSHTHPLATTSDNGFMSKYDKLKLNRLENTNYPHDNLLYDTNYYAPSQTDSAGIYERYISTTAGNDSSENSQLLYSHLMGVKVTLSIEARNTSESSGLTTTPVADDRLPPSPSIMGARLAVYQTGNDTPIYTLDVPITTDDALQLTSDYKRFYATGTLPDVQIDKIRVYYGINCKTTTAGILAVRRPKLELGSQGTEWVQDNWGLIDAGAKKVNKSGDTMTGNLNIQGTYYPSFKLVPTNKTYGQKNSVFEGSYVGETSMSVWDTTDGQNRRMLVLRGANYMNTNGTYTMDNALQLRVATSGSWTGYRVFHEGITTPIPIANGGTGAGSPPEAMLNLMTHSIIADANEAKNIGYYSTDTSTTNLPISGSYGILTVVRVGYADDSSWILQYWSSTNGNNTQIYMRKNINNQGFGEWYQIISSDGGEINKGTLTVSQISGFNYSGMEEGTSPVSRCVWFSDASTTGKPCYSSSLQYNPGTHNLTVGGNSVYHTGNIIYSSTQPSNPYTGVIWLKPV